MRPGLILLILLVLLFKGPAAVAQDAANGSPSIRQHPTFVQEKLPLPPHILVPPPDRSERLAEDHALRQVHLAVSPSADRAGDFLYQVLLTAVSTLVAALIWRALD